MIDWKACFRNSASPNAYAKYAKAAPGREDQAPFADLHTNIGRTEPPILEDVLRGLAIELWSDALGERFWLVADEVDAAKLGERRGSVYTATEARRVVRIGDPAAVAEIHWWKRKFEGVIRER
jgi:hypothetical protein